MFSVQIRQNPSKMVFVFAYLIGCLSANHYWERTALPDGTTTTEPWTAQHDMIGKHRAKCEREPMQLHVGRRGKVIREGSNSMIIRVKQPVPESKNYTVFLVFNREACGLDFMKKMFSWEYPKLR